MKRQIRLMRHKGSGELCWCILSDHGCAPFQGGDLETFAHAVYFAVSYFYIGILEHAPAHLFERVVRVA